jgi:phosphoribosylglycinamide formyltransferase-1
LKKLLFLASGRGSNFQAITQAIQDGRIRNAQAVGLICNTAGAPVIEIAEKLGVPTTVLSKDQFRNAEGRWVRAEYEKALGRAMQSYDPDWICLAGYMLLLGKQTVAAWPRKIINIHPSLLPAFKGLEAQKQALEAGAKRTGCTVHLVTEALDDGPILEQSTVEIEPSDTPESLSRRLLPVEHTTYIKAVDQLCNRPFRLEGSRWVWA